MAAPDPVSQDEPKTADGQKLPSKLKLAFSQAADNPRISKIFQPPIKPKIDPKNFVVKRDKAVFDKTVAGGHAAFLFDTETNEVHAMSMAYQVDDKASGDHAYTEIGTSLACISGYKSAQVVVAALALHEWWKHEPKEMVVTEILPDNVPSLKLYRDTLGWEAITDTDKVDELHHLCNEYIDPEDQGRPTQWFACSKNVLPVMARTLLDYMDSGELKNKRTGGTIDLDLSELEKAGLTRGRLEMIAKGVTDKGLLLKNKPAPIPANSNDKIGPLGSMKNFILSSIFRTQAGKTIETGHLIKSGDEYYVRFMGHRDVPKNTALQSHVIAALKKIGKTHYLIEKDDDFFHRHLNAGNKVIGTFVKPDNKFMSDKLAAHLLLIYPHTRDEANLADPSVLPSKDPHAAAVISNVLVHQDFRGNKLMQQMLDQALRVAREDGKSHAVSEVSTDNDFSWSVFLDAGFVIYGGGHDNRDNSDVFYMHKPLDREFFYSADPKDVATIKLFDAADKFDETAHQKVKDLLNQGYHVLDYDRRTKHVFMAKCTGTVPMPAANLSAPSGP